MIAPVGGIATIALMLAADVAAPAARPPEVIGDADVEAFAVLPSVDFTFAVPRNGATMPKNARLLTFGQFFDDKSNDVDEPGLARDVVFERINDDLSRTTLSADVVEGAAGPSNTAYIVDLGELVVGEAITVTCDLCFDSWSATVIDAVDATPPAFNPGNKNRVAVTDMGADVGYQVRACIPAPIDAAGGAVALRIVTDVRDGLSAAIQGSGANGGCGIDEVDVAVFADGDARPFCFQTLAVDGAGNTSLFHEDVCTELPPHAEGCSQTSARGGSSSLAALAALAAALALARSLSRPGRA